MGARVIHRPAYRRFCATLRAWREEAGMTQREVAEKLGKPHSFVHKSEIGERRLDALEFAEFCRALGRDPAASLLKMERLTGK
ncbi:MAG: helix-turn-helix transcriptional regulator [Tepidisphaeraceae bacterium]